MCNTAATRGKLHGSVKLGEPSLTRKLVKVASTVVVLLSVKQTHNSHSNNNNKIDLLHGTHKNETIITIQSNVTLPSTTLTSASHVPLFL